MTFDYGITLVAIFFLLGGAWLVWKEMSLGKAAHDWPTARGVVSRSTVVQELDDGDGPGYTVSVAYLFEVDGKLYEGRRLHVLQNVFGTPDPAKQLADKYPENTEVTVYYDPHDPNNALLEPGYSRAVVLILVALLAVAGVLVLKLMGVVDG